MSINSVDLKDMNILIVDDVAKNIDVLRNMLGESGFIISIAINGEIALKLANNNPPDLILLDVMMSGINGFETCERLKANEKTANIPIIFVTARTETDAVVQGFKVGGIDYITKPFNHAEVLSRVKTHLRIQRLLQEQQKLNTELQNQNDELIESENQFNIIVDRVTDGVFRLDPEGKIIKSNFKFASALGYSESDILNKPIKDFIDKESPTEILWQIATRRSRERATSNLEVRFCVNDNSNLENREKYFTMNVDSFGIWNLPNTIVMDKNLGKKFLGTICIVRYPC